MIEMSETKVSRGPYSETALDYDWLRDFGWYKIPRQERQPTDHVRRCIARETADEELFMVASEDLCIDLAPDRYPNPSFWFCWITRASSQNHSPSVWLHVRQIKTQADLVLLYEGLTGRHFFKPTWNRREFAPKISFTQTTLRSENEALRKQVAELQADVIKMLPLVEAVGSCNPDQVPEHVYQAWSAPSQYPRTCAECGRSP